MAITIKTILQSTIVAIGMAAGAAQALTIDTFLGSGSPKSGDQFELALLQGLVKEDIGTELGRVQTDIQSHVSRVDDLWVIDLATATPGYFILKFGTDKDTPSHYVFKNEGDLNQLVFRGSDVNLLSDKELGKAACVANASACEISKLSHFSYSASIAEEIVKEDGDDTVDPDGDPTLTPGKVPEPASLALLGLGLAGLAFSRRRA